MGYLTANSSVKLIRRTLASTRLLLAGQNRTDKYSGIPNRKDLYDDRRWRQNQFATREELRASHEVAEKGHFPFKSRWKTDPRYTELNLHQIINHTMFAKLKEQTANQCEMWSPVSFCNLNRETHGMVMEFLRHLTPMDGLQWVHDRFAARLLSNYMWWRRRENARAPFTLEDYAESWAVLEQFLAVHDRSAEKFFLEQWTFNPMDKTNDLLDPTATMFFDQPRFHFMAKTLQFMKEADDEVKQILHKKLYNYWLAENTAAVYPVLRLTIDDPEDRRNVNRFLYEMGHRDERRFPQQNKNVDISDCEPWDAWLDRFEPTMTDVIEGKFGREMPRQNTDIPTALLREYYETQMSVEETVCPVINTTYPATVEERCTKEKRGLGQLDSATVRHLMQRYTTEWERLLWEKLISLQIELGEKLVTQTSLLETLKYVETRCFLKLIQGEDATGAALKDFAGKLVRSIFCTFGMHSKGNVDELCKAITFETMSLMMQKTLVQPNFEKYCAAFDPEDMHCAHGNMTSLLDKVAPIPDKYIGLESHGVISRLLRMSLVVHRTLPAALEWANSGRSLNDDIAAGRTNPFLVNTGRRRMENVVRDIAFLLGGESHMFHFSTVGMFCPPKPYKIFNNQVHGGMLLMEQNIHKKNRAENAKTFHIGETPAFEQFPKESMEHVINALNLYNSTGYLINRKVLSVIKEFCQRGGKYTMKLPMQEIWDQPPGTHLVAVDKTDDQYQFVLQCELRLQNEERSLWKGLASFISIADWYGDRPFWLVHAMDYRGRIYPISSLLNYMRADPYRACFNFREGRKLGGKQVDGYTGFEWLLIHTVVVSERKKKATHEQCLKYAYEKLDVIIDSGRNPVGGFRWWELCENPFQTLAACIEVYEASQLDDPADYVSHLPLQQDGTCNGFQHYSAIGRDERGAKFVNVAPGPRPNDLYRSIMNIATELMQNEIDNEPDNFERLRVASLSKSVTTRSLVKRPIMTIPYGVTNRGARRMVTDKLDASVSSLDIKPVSLYITRHLFQSVNETFGNAMDIRKWLTNYNVLIGKLGLQMEWITPMGLPVSQMQYKSTLDHKRASEILLAAKDINVICNQKRNVYSAFPETNVLRANNAVSPNFVHSIDAAHAMLTNIYLSRRGAEREKNGTGQGIVFNSVHDSYWTHACNVAEMNIQLREAFVDIYSNHDFIDAFADHMENHVVPERFWTNRDLKVQNLSQIENDMATRQRTEHAFEQRPSTGELDINCVKDSKYFFC